MNSKGFVRVLALCIMTVALGGCGREQPIDIEELTSQPKTFVGSDTCKMCHLEHYDSWKMTLHSRGLQDALENMNIQGHARSGNGSGKISRRRTNQKGAAAIVIQTGEVLKSCFSSPQTWRVVSRWKRRIGAIQRAR